MLLCYKIYSIYLLLKRLKEKKNILVHLKYLKKQLALVTFLHEKYNTYTQKHFFLNLVFVTFLHEKYNTCTQKRFFFKFGICYFSP
jgi:hypothetical protein